jgi:hypothetical protein
MAPYPFQPMTTKLLRKLTRDNRESNPNIKSLENSPEFASQALKITLELNPQHPETNQSNLRTNNRY